MLDYLLFDIVNVQKLDGQSCNRVRIKPRIRSGITVRLSILSVRPI